MFFMEEDKSLDPVHIRLFGAVGIMLQAQGFPHLIEELFGWGLGLHKKTCGVLTIKKMNYNIYKERNFKSVKR